MGSAVTLYPKIILVPPFFLTVWCNLTAGIRGLLLGVCPLLCALPATAPHSLGISQPTASLRQADSPAELVQALKFLHKSFRLSLFLLGTMPPVGSVNTER